MGGGNFKCDALSVGQAFDKIVRTGIAIASKNGTNYVDFITPYLQECSTLKCELCDNDGVSRLQISVRS